MVTGDERVESKCSSPSHKNDMLVSAIILFKSVFYYLDGKEFDAYISVGKNTNDMEFIERNILNVLERKYNYKFFIDDDNILPQLGKC